MQKLLHRQSSASVSLAGVYNIGGFATCKSFRIAPCGTAQDNTRIIRGKVTYRMAEDPTFESEVLHTLCQAVICLLCKHVYNCWLDDRAKKHEALTGGIALLNRYEACKITPSPPTHTTKSMYMCILQQNTHPLAANADHFVQGLKLRAESLQALQISLHLQHQRRCTSLARCR